MTLKIYIKEQNHQALASQSFFIRLGFNHNFIIFKYIYLNTCIIRVYIYGWLNQAIGFLTVV